MALLGVRVALRSTTGMRRFTGVLAAVMGCLRLLLTTAAFRGGGAGVFGTGVLGAGALGLDLGVDRALGLLESGLGLTSLAGGRTLEVLVDAGTLMGVRIFAGEPSGVVDSSAGLPACIVAGVFLAATVGRLICAFFRSSSCQLASRSAMSPALANSCSYGRGPSEGTRVDVVERTTGFRIGTGLVLTGAVGTFGRRSFKAATALL